MLNRLPNTFIVLLMLTVVVPAVVFGGFQITKIVGTVEVKEAVFASPVTFDMSLYPCQTKSQSITYENKSPLEQHIEVILEVMPDDDGLTISGDTLFTLDPDDTEDVSVFITAACDIEPKAFEVHVEPERVD